jgi:hypothetical protein
MRVKLGLVGRGPTLAALGYLRPDRHPGGLLWGRVLRTRCVANDEAVASSRLPRPLVRGTRYRSRRSVRPAPALRRPRQRRAQREHPPRRGWCGGAVLLQRSPRAVRESARVSRQARQSQEARALASLPTHTIRPVSRRPNATLNSRAAQGRTREAPRGGPAAGYEVGESLLQPIRLLKISACSIASSRALWVWGLRERNSGGRSLRPAWSRVTRAFCW